MTLSRRAVLRASTPSESRTRAWDTRRARLDAAFWSRCDQSGGPESCWPWTGPRTANGYGQLSRHYKNVKAHRLAYALANGPIPDGLSVMHTCDNPPCVNPAHLRLGTHAENMADMAAKGRVAVMPPERLRTMVERSVATRRRKAGLL